VGRIFLRDLRVRTVIGVEESERRAPQEVLVSLDLELDVEPAAASDDLADALDYAALSAVVVGHGARSRYRLIEAFAGSVAALALERFPRLQGVTVRVEKPQAVPGAKTVGVELQRRR